MREAYSCLPGNLFDQLVQPGLDEYLRKVAWARLQERYRAGELSRLVEGPVKRWLLKVIDGEPPTLSYLGWYKTVGNHCFSLFKCTDLTAALQGIFVVDSAKALVPYARAPGPSGPSGATAYYEWDVRLTTALESPTLTWPEINHRSWLRFSEYPPYRAYNAEMARLAVPAAIAWAESAYFTHEQLAIIKLRLAIEPAFLPSFLEQMKHGKRHEIVL